MALLYLASWFVNFILISIFLAAYDEWRGYRLEHVSPRFLFVASAGVPLVLELIAYFSEGVPFMALIFPWFAGLM